MSDKMKVYVCYTDFNLEGYCDNGCEEPEHVYWYRKDAYKWVEQEPMFNKYKIMEIE